MILGVADQIDILRSEWPHLNPDPALRYYREVYPAMQLLDWIERDVVLIRPGFFSDNRFEEILTIFAALSKARNSLFINHCELSLDQETWRLREREFSKISQLYERQSGSDILVIPVQLGSRHTGLALRPAYNNNTLLDNEFGLFIKDVGTILLANPDLLQSPYERGIVCSAEEFVPDSERAASFFNFNGYLRFDAYYCFAYCSRYFGVATAAEV